MRTTQLVSSQKLDSENAARARPGPRGVAVPAAASQLAWSGLAALPGIVQRARGKPKKLATRIADRERKLHPTSLTDRDARRRVSRSARIFKQRLGRSNTGRNVFLVTVRTPTGRRLTIHLLSAGLGGKHPRLGGKSAAHTEQIWRGLLASGVIHDRLGIKRGTRLKILTMYSRNAACDSNPGDEHGCRSIPASDMHLPATGDFLNSSDYQTGGQNKPISLAEMVKLDPNEEDRAADSDDEFLDSEQLRDTDLEQTRAKDLDKIITRNPPM